MTTALIGHGTDADPAPAAASTRKSDRRWQYYGTYGSVSACNSAARSDWFYWACLPNCGNGRNAYELWHYDY